MRYIPAFLLASVALLLAGCIILALPLPPLGTQSDREDIETLELGRSTREQVHETLGEPWVMVTDRYEIFEVSEETLNVAYMWGDMPGTSASCRSPNDTIACSPSMALTTCSTICTGKQGWASAV